MSNAQLEIVFVDSGDQIPAQPTEQAAPPPKPRQQDKPQDGGKSSPSSETTSRTVDDEREIVGPKRTERTTVPGRDEAEKGTKEFFDTLNESGQKLADVAGVGRIYSTISDMLGGINSVIHAFHQLRNGDTTATPVADNFEVRVSGPDAVKVDRGTGEPLELPKEQKQTTPPREPVESSTSDNATRAASLNTPAPPKQSPVGALPESPKTVAPPAATVNNATTTATSTTVQNTGAIANSATTVMPAATSTPPPVAASVAAAGTATQTASQVAASSAPAAAATQVPAATQTLAPIAGTAAGGLIASLGPAALAVAGLTAAVVAGAVVMKSAFDAMKEQVDLLEGYSVDVANVAAINELRQEMANMRRADRIGRDLAKADNTVGKVQEKMADLQTEMYAVLLKMFNRMEPLVDLVGKQVDNATIAVKLISGIGDLMLRFQKQDYFGAGQDAIKILKDIFGFMQSRADDDPSKESIDDPFMAQWMALAELGTPRHPSANGRGNNNGRPPVAPPAGRGKGGL